MNPSAPAAGAEDLQLIAASMAAIGLSVWLVVRVSLHPFLSLICAAFVLGFLAGIPAHETAAAVQSGFADVLGGAGIVIALGLVLGAVLRVSGAAGALADASLRIVGTRYAPWGCLCAAMLIGLPLFFETGVVLLLPIVAAAAAKLPATGRGAAPALTLMLPALAGLSVLHALLPPHPGPLLAAHELGADVGRTMFRGALVAVPTAIVAGPLFAHYAARNIRTDEVIPAGEPGSDSPNLAAALFVILLPVALIAVNSAREALPTALAANLRLISPLGNPVIALLIAIMAGLGMLFPSKKGQRDLRRRVWDEAMRPAGTLLLSIGAGGALKQVLVVAGVPHVMARFADTGLISPLIMAWTVAALIRIGTGSATVATITAAGVMHGVAGAAAESPEWMVLAIGAGSVFFSHVNDPGFWLVKGYLGTSPLDTFRTWSLLETIISVVGLSAILCASHFLI